MNAVLESKAVENLDIQPGDNVLEVGFGSGNGLTKALKKLEQGSGKVYGIDISEQVVSHQVGLLYSCQLRNVTPSRKHGVLYEAITLIHH